MYGPTASRLPTPAVCNGSEREAVNSPQVKTRHLGEIRHGQRKTSMVLVMSTQVQPASLQTLSPPARICRHINRRSLLIDDDNSLRDSLRGTLHKEGYVIMEASGGLGLKQLSFGWSSPEFVAYFTHGRLVR